MIPLGVRISALSLLGLAGALTVLALLPSTAAWAQSGAITGTVTDASGAVLPGVAVEAASPALIERSRTAVTDGSGTYRIIELRPGAYTVTFMLPSFQVVRRENIQLTTGFTATVNADLTVGNLAETVTASGATPLKTVQAVACIPGFRSDAFMMRTGPVLGGLRGELPANARTAVAANARTAAAIRVVICRSGTPYFNCTMKKGFRMSDFGFRVSP